MMMFKFIFIALLVFLTLQFVDVMGQLDEESRNNEEFRMAIDDLRQLKTAFDEGVAAVEAKFGFKIGTAVQQQKQIVQKQQYHGNERKLLQAHGNGLYLGNNVLVLDDATLQGSGGNVTVNGDIFFNGKINGIERSTFMEALQRVISELEEEEKQIEFIASGKIVNMVYTQPTKGTTSGTCSQITPNYCHVPELDLVVTPTFADSDIMVILTVPGGSAHYNGWYVKVTDSNDDKLFAILEIGRKHNSGSSAIGSTVQLRFVHTPSDTTETYKVWVSNGGSTAWIGAAGMDMSIIALEFNNNADNRGGGHISQALVATYEQQGEFETSSLSYVDLPNADLTSTITTVSSTSKILFEFSGMVSNNQNAQGMWIAVTDDLNNVIYETGGIGWCTDASHTNYVPISFSFVHTPGLGTFVYKIRIKSSGSGSVTMFRGSDIATFTVMEFLNDPAVDDSSYNYPAEAYGAVLQKIADITPYSPVTSVTSTTLVHIRDVLITTQRADTVVVLDVIGQVQTLGSSLGARVQVTASGGNAMPACERRYVGQMVNSVASGTVGFSMRCVHYPAMNGDVTYSLYIASENTGTVYFQGDLSLVAMEIVAA